MSFDYIFGSNEYETGSGGGYEYTQFNDILPSLGIKVKFVDSNDPQNFAQAIDEKTRAIVLCSPNNPTGAIYPPEVIAGFFALARARHRAGDGRDLQGLPRRPRPRARNLRRARLGG